MTLLDKLAAALEPFAQEYERVRSELGQDRADLFHARKAAAEALAELRAFREKPPGFEEWYGATQLPLNHKRACSAAFAAGQLSGMPEEVRETHEREVVALKARVAELEAEVASLVNGINAYENPLKARIAELERFLVNQGFSRCDIAACNCGSFHGGHAANRLGEIYDALEHRTQGKTALQAVRELVACEARIPDPETLETAIEALRKAEDPPPD